MRDASNIYVLMYGLIMIAQDNLLKSVVMVYLAHCILVDGVFT